jgi:hypothetical protein
MEDQRQPLVEDRLTSSLCCHYEWHVVNVTTSTEAETIIEKEPIA